MEEDRKDLRAPGVADLVLLGAHLAEHDRVHGLEMARVRGQAQVHGVAVEFAVRGRAEVVLDVAGTVDFFRLEAAALELVEYRPERLAHHVRQDAQPAPVGHADDDLLDAECAAPLDDLLHCGDQALAAVKAEPLGAGVLDVQELLEPFGFHELVQDRLPAVLGEGDFLAEALDPLLEPRCLPGVGDVHVLQGEGAAIGPFHERDNLAYRGGFQPEDVVNEDLPVHVVPGEAVGPGIELRVGYLVAHAERIKVRDEMAADPVGPDQHERANRIEHCAAHLFVREPDPGFRCLGRDLVSGLLLRGGAEIAPLPVERGCQLVAGSGRPVGPGPARSRRLGPCVRFRVAELAEEQAPAFVHRVRVAGIARVQLFDICGVMALEKAGRLEDVIRGLLGHGKPPVRM